MIFVGGSVTNKGDSVAGLHIDPYNKDEVASAIKSAYASPPAGPRNCIVNLSSVTMLVLLILNCCGSNENHSYYQNHIKKKNIESMAWKWFFLFFLLFSFVPSITASDAQVSRHKP